MTRGIPGDKQVIVFANTNNRGGICLFSENEVTILVLQSAQDPLPERPISANPGLKFCPTFLYLPSYVLLRVTFCVIITISRSKGSTACCKLELHVLRQENLT